MSLIAAALALALLAQSPPSDTVTDTLPLVKPVYETLSVWRAGTGKAEAVKEALRVAPSDRLGSPTGGYVCFATEGDSLISLKGVRATESQGLAIERQGTRLVMKVFEGRLLVESFQADLQIETPHGKVEAKAAAFLIELTGSKTRVVALDGSLTFSNSLGSVTVDAGRESEAGAKSAPGKTVAASGDPLRDFDAASRSANLLKNGSFEEGLKDWNPLYPDKSECCTTLEERLAHTGRRSARLDVSNRIFGPGPRASTFLYFSQAVDLVPGKRYLLRAYVRTECRKGTLRPTLVFNEKAKGKLENTEGAWQLTRAVVTPAKAQSRIDVNAKVEGDEYDATLWVDSFFLVELPDLGKK